MLFSSLKQVFFFFLSYTEEKNSFLESRNPLKKL